MAWLQAAPDMPGDGRSRARVELLGESPLATLPDLKWGTEIIASLMEFGPCIHGPSGPAPVPFSEIESWARMTRTYVPSHEAMLLRQLSKDFCAELTAAKNRDRPAPEIPGEDDGRTERVAEGFKNIMQRFS